MSRSSRGSRGTRLARNAGSGGPSGGGRGTRLFGLTRAGNRNRNRDRSWGGARRHGNGSRSRNKRRRSAVLERRVGRRGAVVHGACWNRTRFASGYRSGLASGNRLSSWGWGASRTWVASDRGSRLPSGGRSRVDRWPGLVLTVGRGDRDSVGQGDGDCQGLGSGSHDSRGDRACGGCVGGGLGDLVSHGSVCHGLDKNYLVDILGQVEADHLGLPSEVPCREAPSSGVLSNGRHPQTPG